MFGRKNKKNGLVYQIVGRERGSVEAYRAILAVMQAQYLGLLKSIMEREHIAQTDNVTFDPELMAFVVKQ